MSHYTLFNSVLRNMDCIVGCFSQNKTTKRSLHFRVILSSQKKLETITETQMHRLPYYDAQPRKVIDTYKHVIIT